VDQVPPVEATPAQLDRLRELEAEGEPLSLAEEIAEEAERRGSDPEQQLEKLKQGDIHIA